MFRTYLGRSNLCAAELACSFATRNDGDSVYLRRNERRERSACNEAHGDCDFRIDLDLKEGGLSTSQLRAGLVASIDVVLARCGLSFSVGRLKPERELETKAALIFAQSQLANPA